VIVDDGAYSWQSKDGQKTYPFKIIEGDATGE
jgi:hypothetical protein